MKVTQHIAEAKDTLFSFEILPPLKGSTIDSIHQTMDTLMEFSPAFVDVTYHREEFVYREEAGGLLRKKITKKRPGTVGICAAIGNKYKIDTVPHIICGGFTADETEDALIDLRFLGIDNVLALRGDPIKSQPDFRAELGGHAYAADLVRQIRKMNEGKYQDPELKNTEKTDFCIGVAGYPEKHFEAPNLNTDLLYLEQKIAAGADYIVTQMFFDNQAFFEFQNKCKERNIQIPIIPGIKPITSKKQLVSIPKHFYINLPDILVENILKAKNDEEVKEIGIDWCILQCKELKAAGVPVLHFYTMGKSAETAKIAKAVW
jgi:methylenetetrahydrofolate reductase (NADPH)